jgi:hypothetical protein
VKPSIQLDRETIAVTKPPRQVLLKDAVFEETFASDILKTVYNTFLKFYFHIKIKVKATKLR